jgi:hypothetical protein
LRSPRPDPVALYLSELAEGSRRTMLRGLRTACEFLGGSDPSRFPWHRVRVDRLAALRSDLASRLAPNTANKVLAAVKGALRASWRMGLMSAEDLYRCADVRPVIATLAKRMLRSEQAVRAVARSLESKGYLKRHMKRGETNHFDLRPLFKAVENLYDEDKTKKAAEEAAPAKRWARRIG